MTQIDIFDLALLFATAHDLFVAFPWTEKDFNKIANTIEATRYFEGLGADLTCAILTQTGEIVKDSTKGYFKRNKYFTPFDAYLQESAPSDVLRFYRIALIHNTFHIGDLRAQRITTEDVFEIRCKIDPNARVAKKLVKMLRQLAADNPRNNTLKNLRNVLANVGSV